MKLHLPKALLTAALCAVALPAMGATLTTDNIVTPVEGGNSYLNVGMEYATDTWSGNLTVGDTDTSQGNVDYVGAFTESWGWVTPNGGSSNKTFTSTLKVNGSLTVQGNGKIVLGGQSSSNYTGLEATGGITVTGGSLTATKIITTDLVVSGGTVSTSTSNCTSGNGTSYNGNGAKQSYIKNSLTLSGGSLSFGYTANVQGVGGGQHRMTAFGSSSNFTMNQSGGTLRVYGDMVLRSGSTINQTDNAGIMALRDTVYMNNSGTTTFNQSGDSAKLVIGRLESTGNIISKPQCDFVFNQSGSGLIHLAYGSNLYKAGTITFNQTGNGTINIGGGHDTKLTGSLPTRSDYSLTSFEAINTTYVIDQSGTGTVNVNGALNAGTVKVAGESTLNINKEVTAGSLTQSGSSTINVNAALSTNDVKVSGGKLNVNADVTANSLTQSGTGKVTVDEGVTLTVGGLEITGGIFENKGTISGSAAQAMFAASDIATAADSTATLITVSGGQFVNYGTTTDSILVDDGTLTLEKGMLADVTMTSGNIVVNSNSTTGDLTLNGGNIVLNSNLTTGDLTLNGGTITFEEGVKLTLTEGATLNLSNTVIEVKVSEDTLAGLLDGTTKTVTLFETEGVTDELKNVTVNFTDGTNSAQAKVNGTLDGTGVEITTTTVPEPTTATLSLLALAALAARRRRR